MVTRLLLALASRIRAWRLRARGAALDGPVWLRAIEIPRSASRLHLGTGVALDRGVTLIIDDKNITGPLVSIGARTYINRHTIIDASTELKIGEDCMIGPFCYLTDHDHTRGSDERPASGSLRSAPVHIGHRVWLGAHVTVLKGVSIGPGATIGAGSVVTKNVPAGTTVAGNPAQPLIPKS